MAWYLFAKTRDSRARATTSCSSCVSNDESNDGSPADTKVNRALPFGLAVGTQERPRSFHVFLQLFFDRCDIRLGQCQRHQHLGCYLSVRAIAGFSDLVFDANLVGKPHHMN